MQAYMPLEQGLLTGNMTMDTIISEKDIRNKTSWYKPENRKKVIDMLQGWKPICEKYECELSNIVIAWTIAQSERINVLCGGRKPHHVMKNAKSGELIMTKEDIAKMNEDIENLYSSLGTSIKGNLF